MSDFKYEIVQKIGILSDKLSGWHREINLVSWNGADPKYDIRDWGPNHEQVGKGIALTEEEAQLLTDYLNSTFQN